MSTVLVFFRPVLLKPDMDESRFDRSPPPPDATGGGGGGAGGAGPLAIIGGGGGGGGVGVTGLFRDVDDICDVKRFIIGGGGGGGGGELGLS